MRRSLAFGVAWLAAAVAATAIAWQGVGLIGDQVTDKRSETLSASEIDAALSARGTAGGVGRTATTGARTPTPAGDARTQATAPGGGAPAAGASAPAGTPAGTAPASPPADAATTPAAAAPATPIVETYRMAGGTTTISFTPTAVRMVSATPNPGYWLLRSGPGDNGGWRVEFEGDAGRSRVDAWWAGGPQHRIREDPAGGDGGSGGGGGPGAASDR